MNELRNTIGTRTASPPPIRARAMRPRRRRGGGAPAASAAPPRVRLMTVIGIGSARYPDAFPALLHQVIGDAADRGAVGEDARVGIEPDVDGVVLHGRSHGVLQGARVAGRVERD